MLTGFLLAAALLVWLPFALLLWLTGRLREAARRMAERSADSVPWLDRMRTATAVLLPERDRLAAAVADCFAAAGWAGRLAGWVVRWRSDRLIGDCRRDLEASGRGEIDLPWLAGYIAGVGFDRLIQPLLLLAGMISGLSCIVLLVAAGLWLRYGG